MIPFGDQIGDGEQGALVGGLGEFADGLAGLVGEGLRAFPHPLDALVLFEQGQNAFEGDVLVVALAQDGLHQAALVSGGSGNSPMVWRALSVKACARSLTRSMP